MSKFITIGEAAKELGVSVPMKKLYAKQLPMHVCQATTQKMQKQVLEILLCKTRLDI
ncbi:hypothetical protein MBAV_001282 [Candidatus Magnetobacterium bavaricum]|uniref:Uncharacterized protein n=1 Tax=Candidatus Magnetobacterium bavaricum TaxID=29290 RepID=A0A0F3GX28_9BACT|nr:hypothetical protein MBAV_001282 [Candidatus Magnetobacterium bavaricum]